MKQALRREKARPPAPVHGGGGLGPTCAIVARKLATAPDRFISVKALVVAIGGKTGEEDAKLRSMRTAIYRLRRNFPSSIGSRYGVGYCLVSDSKLHNFLRSLDGQ